MYGQGGGGEDDGGDRVPEPYGADLLERLQIGLCRVYTGAGCQRVGAADIIDGDQVVHVASVALELEREARKELVEPRVEVDGGLSGSARADPVGVRVEGAFHIG